VIRQEPSRIVTIVAPLMSSTPHVADQPTVLVAYPKAQGVIKASWTWPFNRKDA
jgi:hypothetical protein